MFVAQRAKEDADELYPMIGRIEGLAGRQAAQFPRAEREDLTGELAKGSALEIPEACGLSLND